MSKFVICGPNYVKCFFAKNPDYDRLKEERDGAHAGDKFLVMILGESDLINPADTGLVNSSSFKCSLSHFMYPDLVIFTDHRNHTEICLKEKTAGLYQQFKERI